MSIMNSPAATEHSTGPATNRTRRPAVETRALILDIAERLFYWQGIRATGIDQVVAEAGIAPTTLYRLFVSKDDLVAAYVDRYAAGYREWIEMITTDPSRSVREQILAVIDGLLDTTGPESFRGCPFLMALAEFPDPQSPAHVSAQAVKAWVRDRLGNLTRQIPDLSPAGAERVADQLALVVEGLYASTAALGSAGPAHSARALAELILGQRI